MYSFSGWAKEKIPSLLNAHNKGSPIISKPFNTGESVCLSQATGPRAKYYLRFYFTT